MSKQIQSIQSQNESNIQINDTNRFLACEEIVDELVEQGLPKTFSPENFISKISQNYGISYQEAKTCLKLAVKQLEAQTTENENQKEEKRYAQCGYFYPQGYSQSVTRPKDGMDSLSSLGSYNKLMFGLR